MATVLKNIVIASCIGLVLCFVGFLMFRTAERSNREREAYLYSIFEEGEKNGAYNLPIKSCPYEPDGYGRAERSAWIRGWTSARIEAAKKGGN